MGCPDAVLNTMSDQEVPQQSMHSLAVATAAANDAQLLPVFGWFGSWALRCSVRLKQKHEALARLSYITGRSTLLHTNKESSG